MSAGPCSGSRASTVALTVCGARTSIAAFGDDVRAERRHRRIWRFRSDERRDTRGAERRQSPRQVIDRARSITRISSMSSLWPSTPIVSWKASGCRTHRSCSSMPTPSPSRAGSEAAAESEAQRQGEVHVNNVAAERCRTGEADEPRQLRVWAHGEDEQQDGEDEKYKHAERRHQLRVYVPAKFSCR